MLITWIALNDLGLIVCLLDVWLIVEVLLLLQIKHFSYISTILILAQT